MWKAESEAIEGGLRYRLFEKSKPMSYKDLVLAWRRDLAFCEFFSSVLAGSPFPAFRFELHPLAHHMVDDPCEFVLLESPELGSSFDRRDNSEGFAEWSFPVIDYPTLGILAVKRMFHRLSNPATRDDEETDEGTDEETDEETTRIQEASDPSYGRLPHIGNFVNVTNDAMLIVPSPQEAERVYAHLGVFLRETNERQRWEIWNMLGCDLAMWGAGIPLHVGTPAGGPPWVHLRVDRKPWLTYPPYRDYVPPALNSAPEAAPEPKKAPRKRASRPRKTKDG